MTDDEERDFLDIAPELKDPKLRERTLRLVEKLRAEDADSLEEGGAEFLGSSAAQRVERALASSKKAGRPALRLVLAAAAGLLLMAYLLFTKPWDGAAPANEYEAKLGAVAELLPPALRDPLSPGVFRAFVAAIPQMRNGAAAEFTLVEPRGGIVEPRPRVRLRWNGPAPDRPVRFLLAARHELGSKIEMEFESESGQRETSVSFAVGKELDFGWYVLKLVPRRSEDGGWEEERAASTDFALVPPERVAEIRAAAPRTGNSLLDRQLLAARLLLAKDQEGRELRLAGLALAELEDAPDEDASARARGVHLLLQARALEILGRTEEVERIRTAWQNLSGGAPGS